MAGKKTLGGEGILFIVMPSQGEETPITEVMLLMQLLKAQELLLGRGVVNLFEQ